VLGSIPNGGDEMKRFALLAVMAVSAFVLAGISAQPLSAG
jgi:hypothetical protein